MRKKSLIIGLVFCLASALLGGSILSAAGDLPPRPPVPTAEPPVPVVTGAFIRLETTPAAAGLSTGLQWRDLFGRWHDVDGWRGETEPDGSKLWWVAPRDLGSGPFRWLVIDAKGKTLGSSAPFDLPARTGETLPVVVKLNS